MRREREIDMISDEEGGKSAALRCCMISFLPWQLTTDTLHSLRIECGPEDCAGCTTHRMLFQPRWPPSVSRGTEIGALNLKFLLSVERSNLTSSVSGQVHPGYSKGGDIARTGGNYLSGLGTRSSRYHPGVYGGSAFIHASSG